MEHITDVHIEEKRIEGGNLSSRRDEGKSHRLAAQKRGRRDSKRRGKNELVDESTKGGDK